MESTFRLLTKYTIRGVLMNFTLFRNRLDSLRQERDQGNYPGGRYEGDIGQQQRQGNQQQQHRRGGG